MKGIWVREIEKCIYKESEFEEVAKILCVYGGCRAVTRIDGRRQ